jgi:formate hydrogenlyase transcriptional activator
VADCEAKVAVETEATLDRDLAERLEFEKLMADISSRFVNVPSGRVDQEIEDAQRCICECIGIDHSSVWQADPNDPGQILLTHLFRDPNLAMPPERTMAAGLFPWALSQHISKGINCIARMADLPAEAAQDRESYLYYGIKSTLGFSLSTGGGPMFGILSFDATREERDWPEPLQVRLHLIAQVFANALARKQADQTLRESEKRLSLAADSANAGLWTLEPESGKIWGTEKTFQLLGLPWSQDFLIGEFVGLVHSDDRAAVEQAIREALQSGEKTSVEYRIVHPDGSIHWLATHGQRHSGVNGCSDRLMGVAIEITESKRVEEELKKLKDQLQRDNVYLQQEVKVARGHQKVMGQSPALLRVLEQAQQVAGTSSTVLLIGETGTGKELMASMIHEFSSRSSRPMVRVSCAAIPETLIESELFGREKGAYTGAMSRQVGRFELAHGSTLFLDEIGELPLESQAKLLRVLQERVIERLGSARSIPIDVRIIAATNRDLEKLVKENKFRDDLFYRLNVFPIRVPPLRERVEDIPVLIQSFVREFATSFGKTIERIDKASIDALQRYSWPGNIREMRNTVERAMILANDSTLYISPPYAATPQAAPSLLLSVMEREHLRSVLQMSGWRVRGKDGAAEILGLKPTTLDSMIQRHRLQPSQPNAAVDS